MNEWISIQTKLPPDDVLVLCIGAKGGMFLGIGRKGYACIGSEDSCYMSVPNSRGGRYATHWMPLPESPKNDK